jgi:hypothetical protein
MRVLNKQCRTTDKELSSNLKVEDRANNSICFTKGPRTCTGSFNKRPKLRNVYDIWYVARSLVTVARVGLDSLSQDRDCEWLL